MQAIGPNFGYCPKPSKTWLVVKPEYLERAKEQFHGINITDQGHTYLTLAVKVEKLSLLKPKLRSGPMT